MDFTIGKKKMIKTDIDREELKNLMRFYPSLDEVAGWFDVSPDTIERLIKAEWIMSFAEFRSRFNAPTKIALKRIAIEKALSGNDKMLIHCLRSMTDLNDRHPLVDQVDTVLEFVNPEDTVRLAYNLNDE